MFLYKISSWIFPPVCVHCRQEGAWLCPAAMTILSQEKIIVNPLAIDGVDRVIVRGSYDCPTLQQVIHQFKYSYWSSLQEVLPGLITPLIPAIKRLPTDTVIIPIPIHRRRSLERGFNQSEIIARALSQISQRPMLDLLRRKKYTAPQAQLSEPARRENVKDVFRINYPVAKLPKSVIIVDDVVTTGATVRECAKVLRHHGVKHIITIALAKG